MLNASTLTTCYRRRTAIAAAIIFILIALASGLGLFNWLNFLLYDIHFKVRGMRPTSNQVVLVYMNEESAVRLQRHQGSWSRQHMAKAILNLTAAGGEIIALDMIFSAPALDHNQDIELADAIYQSNNVVLARISSAPGLGSVDPLPIFQQGMIGDGFIDLPLDLDDCLRKVRFLNARPLANGTLQLLPSFALEVARTYRNLDYEFDFSHTDFFTLGGSDQEQLKLPFPELLINYYGNDNVFTQLNYADVVTNQFDPQQVAGKIILVGSKLKTEKDVFNTPFTRYRRVNSPFAHQFAKSINTIQEAKEPGMACHAHAIETILNQSFITPLSNRWNWVLLIIITALGYPLFFRQTKTGNSIIAGSIMLIIILGLCQLAFQHGLWVKSPPLLAAIMCQLIAGFTLLKIYEQRRSEWVTSIFGKYVSESIVDRLVQGEITPNMDGQHKELTILFADLRSFTSISEQLSAQQTTQLLNTFFAAMIPQIQDRQGTVDKLIGDAIMAFFGAPVTYADHAKQAATAALNMLQTLHELKLNNDLPGIQQLEIGIGLNSGEVTVGNLGCEDFMDYTVIGDNVNLAARMEGLNKVYGSHILLSEQTAKLLDDNFTVRELDLVRVKGKHNTTNLYELVGFSSQLDNYQLELLQLFAKGLELYRNRNWSHAQHYFKQALALNPDDTPSSMYLHRIAQLQANPPEREWDGITYFMRK